MKQPDNKKLPVSLKRVANMGRLLFDSLLAILFVMYAIGIYGAIRSFKNQNEIECKFYTFIMVFNVFAITATFYIITKLWS